MAGSSDQFLNLQKAIRQQALIHKRLLEQRLQFMDAFRRSAELTKRRIEEPFRQIAKQGQQFADSLQRSVELSRRHFEEAFKPLQQLADSARQLAEVPKRFAEQQQEFFESLQRLAKELPKRQRKALQRLGEEGWFLDPAMPATLLQELERLFDEHPDEMTEWLKGFFRERIDAIEEQLIASYPHRGHLFQQAFEAHREGKYGLSVPVFLAQADGIFWERTPARQNLFRSKQREKAYSQYVSKISDSYTVIDLHPLSILLPLWMNEDERAERGDSFVGLNRHQVLHGESVDYSTEQNSLKAISLLSYLHRILSKTGEPKCDD